MPELEKQPLCLSAGNLLDMNSTSARNFSARFVRAGRVRRADNLPSNMLVDPQALKTAVEQGLFNNRCVFIDHAGMWENASLRNLVGYTADPAWNESEQSIDGTIRLFDTPDAQATASLLEQILAAPQEQRIDVGLSMVFWPMIREQDNDRVITGITHIESIDLVFQPAADGRILCGTVVPKMLCTDLPKNPQAGANNLVTKEGFTAPFHYSEDILFKHGIVIPNNFTERNPIMTEPNQMEPNISPPVSPAAPAEPAQAVPQPNPDAIAWLHALANSAANAIINASDLPRASKDRLLMRSYTNPDEIKHAVDEEKTYLASLAEASVITNHGAAPRSPQIQMGRSGFDQLSLAFEAMLDGVRPAEGIRPLSGIREFYNLISGDFELTGQFHPERVQFANVTSSTMASLVANALNKRVVNRFAEYPKWWQPIASEEDFANLQQIKWITLAGIGALPTVSEGQPYTELPWDDKTETADFIKKGGYLGITMEAIDKDDTRKLRTAPQALAQGAYLTLSASISALFTANSGAGATMSDTNPVFHSSHGNIGSTPLSATAWASTRQAMRDQTEFAASGGSTAALGALTAPKFVLVPNELENLALQILGAATAGSANYLDNVWAEGDSLTERMRSARTRVIVVDLWTDAADWVAMADPLLYPSIGIGYRYGRVPEVFSVANPTSGLMFTNDVMPVKVRFFYAAGILDWRGLYKHVIT